MKRLICALFGHRSAPFAGRKYGRHLAGTVCLRCDRVLSLRAGSRQERRRIMRERMA